MTLVLVERCTLVTYGGAVGARVMSRALTGSRTKARWGPGTDPKGSSLPLNQVAVHEAGSESRLADQQDRFDAEYRVPFLVRSQLGSISRKVRK